MIVKKAVTMAWVLLKLCSLISLLRIFLAFANKYP